MVLIFNSWKGLSEFSEQGSNVVARSGAGLNKHDVKFADVEVTQNSRRFCFPFLSCDLSFVGDINLVGDEDDDHAVASLSTYIFNPSCGVDEGRAVSHIIDYNRR